MENLMSAKSSETNVLGITAASPVRLGHPPSSALGPLASTNGHGLSFGTSALGLTAGSKAGLTAGSSATPGFGLKLPGGSKGVISASSPAAAATPGDDGGGAAGDRGLTNVDALNDAVGIAGVDINAEEEGLRLANERSHVDSFGTYQGGLPGAVGLPPPALPMIDRSRKQDFIEPGVLAEAVKKIAAAFQLRTLEPDTIPFIALATRHRLMSLISASISARDHRLNASHLRNPPMVIPQRRHSHRRFQQRGAKIEHADQSSSDGENHYGEDGRRRGDELDSIAGSSSASLSPSSISSHRVELTHDDLDDCDGAGAGMDLDSEERKPTLKKRRYALLDKKADMQHDKIEKIPAWDQVVFDEPEILLGALEKLDREEERKKRRERMLRDEREQAEKDLAEAIAATQAALNEDEAGIASSATKAASGGIDLGRKSGGAPGTPMGQDVSGSNIHRESGGDEKLLGKEGKHRKQKRPRKETPASTARNMSEDVKKRLTDQVAMRSLGGKSFAWLNATPGAGTGMMGSPSPNPFGARSKASESSTLPPPSFANPLNSSMLEYSTGLANFSRLSNIPELHDANRANWERDDWNKAQHIVKVGDFLWAMERERGLGVGRGSGRNTLLRARAGARPILRITPSIYNNIALVTGTSKGQRQSR